MQNTQLRRELSKIAALAAAIADLAAIAHADSLEPGLAELASLARVTYESFIDNAILERSNSCGYRGAGRRRIPPARGTPVHGVAVMIEIVLLAVALAVLICCATLLHEPRGSGLPCPICGTKRCRIAAPDRLRIPGA